MTLVATIRTLLACWALTALVAAQDVADVLRLDGGDPRIVVQCSGELWAAFDHQTGRLISTWNGDVITDEQGLFQIRGHVYTGAEPEPRWELERDGKLLAGRRRLTGHDTEEGWLRMHGEVSFPDGTTLQVSEVVDAWRDGRRREGRPIVLFDRSFILSPEGLPEGAALRVWLEVVPTDVVWQGDPWPAEGPAPTPAEGEVVRAPFTLEPGQRCTWTRIWPRCRDAWLPEDELPERANRLSDAEREAGWRWLFDGQDASAWRGAGRQDLPEGWVVADGCLVRRDGGGDLVTREAFGDFELSWQWKISPGGNSGVFFHVDDSKGPVYVTGPEYQILDNERHPDGRRPETSAAANYGLHPAAFDLTMPVGFFNRSFLRVRDGLVEHWINGYGVARYELGSEDWQALVADSKFAAWEHYGRLGRGSIALQDHGDLVWFRAIKIRPLD